MPFYLNEENMQQKNKYIFSILFFFLIGENAFSQRDSITFSFRHYGLEKDEENEIVNAESLNLFFEKLYQLRKGDGQQVNLIQIGDSHIQADYLSGTIRQNIQRDFGNAGRGLVVPGRVARTNEAYNIYTSSPTPWESKRCVFPDQSLPIGISGITLNTQIPNAQVKIKMLENSLMDYSFDRLTLFYKKDFTSFNFVVRDSVNEDLAFIGPFTFESYPNVSKVILPKPQNQVILKSLPPVSPQTHATIFGISLENGKKGVLYHAIGVNGAKYLHYNEAAYFAEQTVALFPDLFIISLGTNEAIDHPYIDVNLPARIDQLIQSLKSKNPNAAFILTTPPDSFKKKTRRNPGVETVKDIIIRYAEKNRLAYWDLFAAAGGRHSADLYRKYYLLSRDGIHFTKEGYELQGNLFYSALIKSYNTYVSYRHP
jgi:lysophospholipase L1-like esterase